MADEIASLKVVIEAEDRASEAIANINANINGLSSAGTSAAGRTQALSAAMTGSAKNSSVLGSAVERTKNNIRQLESGLEAQKNKTREYSQELRNSASVLKEKQNAVKEASAAYKTNSERIKNNIDLNRNMRDQTETLMNTKKDEIDILQRANAHLNSESEAYKNNQQRIESLKSSVGHLEKRKAGFQKILSENESALKKETQAYKNAQAEVSKAAKEHDTLKEKISASKSAEHDYRNEINKANESLAEQEKEFKRLSRTEGIKNAGKSMKELGAGIDTVTKPLQYASAATMAIATASAKTAIDFEDNFAGVKKTVDGTPEQLEEIKKGIIALSTTGINGRSAIPQTTQELTELAAAGGQLGIQTENIVEFTETMAQLGSATNLAGEQGASVMARFANVMQIPQSEIRNTASAIVELGNNSATTESEIADMALRMGKYGQTVRMSAADVLGYSAALSSMGIEAQLGGSAVGRTWLSIETAVASGGSALKAFAKYAGKSADEFKKQWNTDSKGAFNGLLKGLKAADNLTLALSELGIENTQDINVMMALVNGYELVTESVERANTAYKENTALQAEFDAKAETTASKLQVTKQNITEAARSFGETLVPFVSDASEKISEFAQGLAAADESTKKTAAEIGAVVIGVGALAKGVSIGIKSVGGFIEAIGTITGIAGKAGSAIGAAASAANPLVIALAAISAAAGVGVVAYKKHREAMINWSEGMEETASEAREHMSAFEKLNSLQFERRELVAKINTKNIGAEELERAKQRIQEIDELLAKEYKIEVEVDDSQVDDAIEKLKQYEIVMSGAKQAELENKLVSGKDTFESSKNRITELQNEKRIAQERITSTYELGTALQKLKNEWDELSEAEQKAQRNSFADRLRDIQSKYGVPLSDGFSPDNVQDWIDNVPGAVKMIEDSITGIETEMEGLNASIEEYKASAKELADLNVMGIELGDVDGKTTAQNIDQIAAAVKSAGLSATEYAQKTALAQTGMKSFNDVAAQGGATLDEYISNYIANGEKFGATSRDLAVGAALLKNGFTDVQSAADKGALDSVAVDLAAFGQSMGMSIDSVDRLAHYIGLLPEHKKIQVNADGNFEIIDAAAQAVKELNSTGNVKLKVDADGNITILKTADEKLKELKKNNEVTVTFNADTGGFDISDLQGKKLGEITVDGKVNWESGETPDEVPNAKGKADFEVGESPETVPDASGKVNIEVVAPEEPVSIPTRADVKQAKADIQELNSESVTVPVSGKTEKLKSSIDQYNGRTITVNVAYKPLNNPIPNAKGTDNFSGGLAVVNDERGIADPRELIVHDGKGYIFEGRDVVVSLDKGDKVYTAEQTKKMLPHFAGGSNNEAFENAKSDFEYRQKTSVVTNAEALLWWKNILEEYAHDTEVVKEANIEIYDLTKKINDESVQDYKKRIQKQESNSQEWIDREVKLRNMSADEQIAAYRRMDENYLNTLQEMTANTEMTEEELSEVWDDYYKSIRKHEEEIFDLQKQKLEEANELSSKYFSERTYFNDWQSYGDDPIEAYNRVRDRNAERLNEGIITYDEYIEEMKQLGKELYEGRLENSEKWLDTQKKYGNISEAEYLAGLKRVFDYTKQYGELGILQGQDYAEAMDSINSKIFDNQKAALEEYLEEYYDAQKKQLDARKAEIEAEYKAQEDAEEKADREKEREELLKEYEKYQNAVTIDGKKRLEEIKDSLDELDKEDRREARDAEKQARLDELDAMYDELEKEQENALKGVDRYTAQAIGIIDGGNTKMAERFNELISSCNTQQERLARTGYETVCSIVDAANAKLSELGSPSAGETKVTITQTFNNNITDEASAAAYGKYAGASVRQIAWGSDTEGR